MRTVAFVTFGCKVNQYESQALREQMGRRGFSEVEPDAGADVYVVNSCTVTQSAFKDAERAVRTLHRRFPLAAITVTGCAADSNRADFEGLPGVVRVVPHDEKSALPLYIGDPRLSPADLHLSIFDLSVSAFHGHTRAFLKVQDGCNLNCSFCIIPKVRGPSVSRDLDDCVDEARRLVGNGYREIVVTGVHVGSFKALPALFARMMDIEGLGRARLSSLEAEELHDDLLDVMAGSAGRFCPHLHLPVQSGDDEILRAMRRRTNRSQFLRAVDRARARVPGIAISTDVIVGFPGETDAQFENTLDLVRRCEMSRVHVFPYSRRAGTDAAAQPDLPEKLKKERLLALESLAAGIARRVAERFVGREVEVLVERGGQGYTGHYLRAKIDAPPGPLVRARVTGAVEGVLQCER